MKRYKYSNNYIYKLYLDREEIELILNAFDFYLNIFKNLKCSYLITDKEYKEVFKNYNTFAQKLYNIYIDKL